MKRIFVSIVLFSASLFVITSCGGKKDEVKTEENKKEEYGEYEIADSPEPKKSSSEDTVKQSNNEATPKTEDVKEEKTADPVVVQEPKKPSSEELIKQGQTLVSGSDCKVCHHPTNKIVGPSHTDVAKKYEFTQANIKLLAGKIINGGSGNWGDIPMTAHPDITQGDAEKMAMYVLSLDGEKPKK